MYYLALKNGATRAEAMLELTPGQLEDMFPMPTQYQPRKIEIVRCSDAMLWYAKLTRPFVRTLVRADRDGFWVYEDERLESENHFLNKVLFDDARVMPDTQRDCKNCKYAFARYDMEPCGPCVGRGDHPNWEPE